MSATDLLSAGGSAAPDGYVLPAYLRAPEVTSKVMAEYIWLGRCGQLRSKTKVLDTKPAAPEEAPVVVVTEGNPECEGEVCEDVFLKPRKVFRDPFRGGDHILVLCDTFRPSTAAPPAAAAAPVVEPCEGNTRVACENVMKMAEASKPVLAAEQQYAVIHPAYPTLIPMGPARRRRSSARSHQPQQSASKPVPIMAPGSWPKASGFGGGPLSSSLASPTTSSFISGSCCPGAAPAVPSAPNNMGRNLSEAHLRCCLFAGVNVTGADAQAGSQGVQSYKVGPCQGVDFGDQVWASRYLLQRVAEDHGAAVSWNARASAGGPPLACHVKYSSAETRTPATGVTAVQQQLGCLQEKHLEHVAAYYGGRMDLAAAAGHGHFTHSIGGTNAGVTVPSLTLLCQGGYYVDRRPPSDADPYAVAMMLASTTLSVPLPVPIPVNAPAESMDANLSKLSSYNVNVLQRFLSNASAEDCGMMSDSYDEQSGDDEENCDDDGCGSESDSMETGSVDLLLDELERMDREDGDDDEPSGSDDCESEGECDSDGTSPDRSAQQYDCTACSTAKNCFNPSAHVEPPCMMAC